MKAYEEHLFTCKCDFAQKDLEFLNQRYFHGCSANLEHCNEYKAILLGIPSKASQDHEWRLLPSLSYCQVAESNPHGVGIDCRATRSHNGGHSIFTAHGMKLKPSPPWSSASLSSPSHSMGNITQES